MEQIGFRIDPEQLADLDDLAAALRMSRSDAIRQILALGLAEYRRRKLLVDPEDLLVASAHA